MYNFCPFSSAIPKYLLFELNIGFVISIVKLFCLFPEFIIFTTESAVNIPDYFSSTFMEEFSKSIDANETFLSLYSCIISILPSSFISVILFVYIHNILFFS